MKYTLLSLIAGLLLAQTLQAQSTPADPELNDDLRDSYENAELRARLNTLSSARSIGPSDVMIMQVGSGHEAFVQTRALTGAEPTQVEIMQGGGVSNEAALQLIGDGSEVSVTQNGTANVYNGALRADDAEVTIVQDGNFNEMSQRATLTEGTEMELIQQGDNNVLNADDFSTRIRVTQTGGARATLTEIVPGNPR